MTVENTAIPQPIFMRRPDSGAVVIKRYCGGCAEPWAAFGHGVDVAAALERAHKGVPYRHLLGTWWCGSDGCRVTGARP